MSDAGSVKQIVNYRLWANKYRVDFLQSFYLARTHSNGQERGSRCLKIKIYNLILTTFFNVITLLIR